MKHGLSKRDVDILEEKGLWKASSHLHRAVKKLIRKNLPLEIRYIKEAHRIIFTTAHQESMAGRYRTDNPELKRIDGSLLIISHWQHISRDIAELDSELKKETRNIRPPKTEREYKKTITIAAQLSHWLACIHTFENGNGRSSRLLLNAVLLRVGLPEVAIRKKKPQYLRAMLQADNRDFSLLEKIITDGVLENKKQQLKIAQRKQTRR